MRFLGRVAIEARRVSSPILDFSQSGMLRKYPSQILYGRSRFLPIPVDLVSVIAPVIAVLSGLLDYVNGYALIYVGVTGEPFWPSAKRAIGLAGRRKGSRLLDCKLRVFWSSSRRLAQRSSANRHFDQAFVDAFLYDDSTGDGSHWLFVRRSCSGSSESCTSRCIAMRRRTVLRSARLCWCSRRCVSYDVYNDDKLLRFDPSRSDRTPSLSAWQLTKLPRANIARPRRKL
jgi:hypothetical protein